MQPNQFDSISDSTILGMEFYHNRITSPNKIKLFHDIAMSSAHVTELQKELFWPHQLGVGVKLGGEIACHAIREFILLMPTTA